MIWHSLFKPWCRPSTVYNRLVSAVKVIIEGFKSYKDQTAAEPFSNKINVVGKLVVLSILVFRCAF